MVENRGAVLRTDVVPLLVGRRWIVQTEEVVEDFAVADLRRIELDLDRLRVSRAAGLHILVHRMLRLAAGVPDLGIDHAGQLPEELLDSPKAAARQCRLLRHFLPSNSFLYSP